MFRKGKTRRHALTAAHDAGRRPPCPFLSVDRHKPPGRIPGAFSVAGMIFPFLSHASRRKDTPAVSHGLQLFVKTKSRRKPLRNGRERKGKTALRSPKIINDIPPPGLWPDTETLVIAIVYSGSRETGRSKTEDAEV